MRRVNMRWLKFLNSKIVLADLLKDITEIGYPMS